jgi:hypothetical protein
MTTTDRVRSRTVSVSLLAVLAMVAALLAAAVTGQLTATADSHAEHGTATHTMPAMHGHATKARVFTKRQAAFHDKMRKLWEDHVTWTRLAIVTFADGSAGFEATAGRLLQNQEDLGDAIKPFYGKAAGNQLTALLEEHILVAVELLQAAKAGDTAKVTDASARWYANGNEIADFLAAANPRFWPKRVMRAGMRAHLDQTLAEAQHELGGDYAASVADYEVVHAHMLAMADTLSNGIMRSFPRRFR